MKVDMNILVLVLQYKSNYSSRFEKKKKFIHPIIYCC